MNLAAALLATADSNPDRVALRTPEPVTYGDLRSRAAAAAARIAAAASPGDRVMLVAGNEATFVSGALGAFAAGAVLVPVNVVAPSRELAQQIDTVAPAAVVASVSHEDLARRAVGQAQSEVPIVVLDDAQARRERAGEGDASFAPVSRAPDDLAVLLFTAGTAGSPKPAMLTHGSLLANLEQMQSHPGLRSGPDDVGLVVLPLFHVYGLNVGVNLALYAGAAVSLVDHFHPAETLERVRTDGVTIVAGVPSMFAAWLALDDQAAPADAFANVRLCVSGATALPSEVVNGMRERFGVTVHDGYGLTEASPVVTTTAVAVAPHPGSVGPPIPGVEVRLLDADGNPVLEGDPGEIVVRGPNVFAGYWDDPATTKAVLRDGWLHTGDIAVADSDGWLTLVDRAKDLIIVSGFNVYPGEVEEALRSHESVDDVAVIGEPHPRTGETVVAFVVAAPGRVPDPVELLRHAGRRLARYKLPTRVEVVDALPRTLAGKLVRRALSAGTRADATTKPA